MNTQRRSAGLAAAFALVLLAYIIALSIAFLVAHLLSAHPPIFIALMADMSATFIIYAFGRVFHNSSFYDPYWSLAPIAISIYWTLESAQHFGWQQLLVLSLVSLWGVRLTWHWASGWRGLQYEDWRYSDLRQKIGGWFWVVELTGIDLVPTTAVFLGCLSLYPALMSGHPFGALDAVAIAVTMAAIIIESAADEQLRRFIAGKHQPEDIMESELWAYSRHPNYLGEITFWWGLYLFALSAGIHNWWTIIGPLTITALFVFISIPMMDKHIAERHPGYDERIQKVPALLPRFSKS